MGDMVPGSDNRAFVSYLMADVHALLDFLSGRAIPSLGPLPPRRMSYVPPLIPPAGGSIQSDGETGIRQGDVSADDVPRPSGGLDVAKTGLEISRAFLEEITRISRMVDQTGGIISDGDTAFLIQARDLLNVRASPATGTSIIFTLLVVDALYAMKETIDATNPSGPIYIYREAWLEPAALALAKDVKLGLKFMCSVLFLTVVLSVYVAYGKLLADTRDAVNRDYGANMTYFAAELTKSQQPATPSRNLIKVYCGADTTAFLTYQHCQQFAELQVRKANVRDLMSQWLIWPRMDAKQPAEDGGLALANEEVDQLADARIGVMGNYILPVLYGTIGSLGFILRQFNQRLADRLLTPRESRASRIRLMLGAVCGACIGLFFNSSVGPAQATGIGGAAVTLSASAIAFVAGYGVEAVFKTLDSLLTHLFSLNQPDRDHASHPLPAPTGAHH